MKILGITTIRSDYDLMSRLYRYLNEDPEIDFRLLVGGAHMSSTYGHTVDLIKADGFHTLLELETLIDSDSPQSRLKSASLLLQNSIDAVASYSPDLILYAGDREDVIVGALLGGYLEIPTVHVFGGDHVQDGHIDNAVRHATSKLSNAHFVALEQHAQRLIRMGESPSRIWNIGSIALDKFIEHVPLPEAQLAGALEMESIPKNFALVIHHPISEERTFAWKNLRTILECLDYLGIHTFANYPNTDPGSKDIIRLLDMFQGRPRFRFFKNLPREVFLSLYKRASFLIGNSSSGICEAASIPIPVVNVGKRQRGRYAEGNVLFVDANRDAILTAISRVRSREFLDSIQDMANPYGDGRSSEKAYRIIKETDFRSLLFKKEDILDA